MEKKIIEILIDDLNLEKRGPIDGEEDTNIFKFTLNYPTEEIPSIETVKTVKVTKEIPTNWSSDLDNAIVFKTPIRGRANLKVEVFSVDKDSDGEKAMKSMFKTLVGTSLGIWTGGFSSVYVGAITNKLGTSLIDLIDETDDIDLIGSASYLLNSEELPNKINLDLVVQTAVVQKELSTVGGGPPSRRRRKIIETEIIPVGTNGRVNLIVNQL